MSELKPKTETLIVVAFVVTFLVIALFLTSVITGDVPEDRSEYWGPTSTKARVWVQETPWGEVPCISKDDGLSCDWSVLDET